MAAPDLDSDRYLKLVPKISGSFGMTLYASAADRALLVAKRVAGNVPRAGDVPSSGPLVVNGIDTIDVTAIGAELFGIGHAVFCKTINPERYWIAYSRHATPGRDIAAKSEPSTGTKSDTRRPTRSGSISDRVADLLSVRIRWPPQARLWSGSVRTIFSSRRRL
jgi:esterase/lipase superfamily enzyme